MMPTYPDVKDLVERNRVQATTFSAKPFLSELKAAGVTSPSVVVVTCCDIRVNPYEFFNLEMTDVFHLRNTGGRVGPLINDIIALDYAIGLKEIMIIHHLDCGTTFYTDEGVREAINTRAPGTVDEKDTFRAKGADAVQSVREDVELFKRSLLVRRELAEHTYGFTFDLKSGLVTAVQ